MPRVERQHVVDLEKQIEELTKELGPLQEFILPGGSPVGAQLHVARTICRRAERFCVRLSKDEKVGEFVNPYLNRLSDALFTLARWANKKAGVKETYWKK
jgi:cob(I)alamin adenosyltransferase